MAFGARHHGNAVAVSICSAVGGSHADSPTRAVRVERVAMDDENYSGWGSIPLAPLRSAKGGDSSLRSE